ncbi:MAG: glutathione S-transferase family protein [Hyphomicrobiaceae bacterium]
MLEVALKLAPQTPPRQARPQTQASTSGSWHRLLVLLSLACRDDGKNDGPCVSVHRFAQSTKGFASVGTRCQHKQHNQGNHSGRNVMLKVYGRKSSFNVQKVMWLVDELKVPHEHIERGGSFGGLETSDFLAMNPHGRVPVIDDNGVIVWESHAILRYLAARYGDGAFWSSDPAARARTDQWMDWSQTALQIAFLTGVFWGWYRTPEAKRDMTAVNAAIAKTDACFKLLDRHLEGRTFMQGNQLSLADIPIGTNFYRYFNLGLPRPDIPNVERMFQHLLERPAYQDHVCIPFGDLYGRLAY